MRPGNTVGDKISAMFNNTQPVLPGMMKALGISGMNSDLSKIEQTTCNKIPHPLIVEASDADISQVPSKKHQMQRNPSGIIIKDRALTSELNNYLT